MRDCNKSLFSGPCCFSSSQSLSLPQFIQTIQKTIKIMNALSLPTMSSGGFTDLRASIFPPEDSRLHKTASQGAVGIHQTNSSPGNSLTNVLAVTNLEAALSFKSALNKRRVSNLSASYRTTVSASHRITPHRLGSSFIDFMQRFHEMD